MTDPSGGGEVGNEIDTHWIHRKAVMIDALGEFNRRSSFHGVMRLSMDEQQNDIQVDQLHE